LNGANLDGVDLRGAKWRTAKISGTILEKQLAAEKAEQERQERLAAEKAEQERLAAEKAEKERLAAEKAKQEKLAAEKAERERQERLAAEKAEKEKQAFELLTKEAQGGSAEAQFQLGKMYLNRERVGGVRLDSKEAIKWFEPAAEQGHAEAQLWTGNMYYRGVGTQENLGASIKWHRLAADQGIAPAQSWMGGHYEEGKGVPKDLAEAIKWYRLALEGGYEVTAVRKKIAQLERTVGFEPGLLAMGKPRFLECDAFIRMIQAETIFTGTELSTFDGTYSKPILTKELKIYASVKKSRQISKQEWGLAGAKLLKELKKTYGSDSLKKLMYLDQKTVECGGESKQVAAKKRSLREISSALQKASAKCARSASGPSRRMLEKMWSIFNEYHDREIWSQSIPYGRKLLRTGRQQGGSNCNE